MVDGLHIHIKTEIKKHVAIALSGLGREMRERDDGGNVNNVLYEPNWNCHYESPPV
jgi:hypothetical protein